MANFIGGSAGAMANQVAEGFILLSLNTLKGFTPGDLTALRAELDKLQRETRALVPPPDDALANQARNRRIGRLASAMQIVSHKLTARN
ncbi:MAG TPA: hypothetical protein VMR21_12015 [Vicinamibacteria bacterium]|nr:hypothetical protein [Vicinamibacteria bacterium]